MNEISFDTAKILWENLNSIESALHGYKINNNFEETIQKTANKTAFEEKQAQFPKKTSNHFEKHFQDWKKNQENTERALENNLPKSSFQRDASPFYNKIQECTRCSLHTFRKQAIEGRGIKKPLVLVITEAPTEEDDKTGIITSGEAGQLLDKMLFAISLSTETNTYITPIIKCKPPENKLPLLEQMYACKIFLDVQIQKMQPAFILALGTITSLCLLGPQQNFQAIRGKIFDYQLSKLQNKTIPLLVSYSPHSLLHDESLKRPAWQDLKLVRAKLDEIEEKKT